MTAAGVSSHIGNAPMATDFSKKNPAEILKDDALDKYTSEMQYFHLRLAGLHHDVFIIQRILDFPLDLFTTLEDGYFLRRVVRNFFQVAILQITKLTTDSGPDARTLKQFRNFMAGAVTNEFEAEYRQVLREVRFNSRIKTLLEKAKNLRDTQIAHSAQTDTIGQKNDLTFGEIKVLVDELTKLFEIASFSSEYRYLIMSYDPTVQHPPGNDSRPDIEKILDSIARESSVLNSPDQHPQLWAARRQRWSSKKVEDFNHYRRKFGLPAV